MGLSVILEDEQGVRMAGVEDPENLLHRLLPSADDLRSRCLRYVDWYGDTVFNRRQVIDILNELKLLMSDASTHEERVLLQQLFDLALRCKDGVHLYLKFYGD